MSSRRSSSGGLAKKPSSPRSPRRSSSKGTDQVEENRKRCANSECSVIVDEDQTFCANCALAQASKPRTPKKRQSSSSVQSNEPSVSTQPSTSTVSSSNPSVDVTPSSSSVETSSKPSGLFTAAPPFVWVLILGVVITVLLSATLLNKQ